MELRLLRYFVQVARDESITRAANALHISQPTLSKQMKDLEADSLDAVEIIMALEEEYEIEIPDEVAEEFKTVGDIVNYIEANI